MTEPNDRSEAGRALQSLRQRVPLLCSVCGTEYEGYELKGPKRKDQPRYCSNRCKMRARYQTDRAAADRAPDSSAHIH